MSEKCPKCGAIMLSMSLQTTFYVCGSAQDFEGAMVESHQCLTRQRDALKSKVAALEAENKALREAMPDPTELRNIANFMRHLAEDEPGADKDLEDMAARIEAAEAAKEGGA